MLAKKRQTEILELLQQKGSVTLQELTEAFDASESTIRRDLTVLDQKGALTKVFGGAVSNDFSVNVKEEEFSDKHGQAVEQKQQVGQYAASLVGPDDFVYLDAGTTTEAMIPYLTKDAMGYVTNAVGHALMLARRGCRVILVGGELKNSTEALVGNETIVSIQKYNFTKCFMGTNGVELIAGCTTPELNEALVKQEAMRHSKNCYVLCDASKFQKIYPIRFANFRDVILITDGNLDSRYKGRDNVIVLDTVE